MVIEYTKALFNKVMHLFDVIQGVKKTKEEGGSLPETVAFLFPKDQERIFRIVQDSHERIVRAEKDFNCCTRTFRSKIDGTITVKVKNYRIENPPGRILLKTQLTISNDRGKVIEFIS